jgi:very-short-patch-repair endonuclease
MNLLDKYPKICQEWDYDNNDRPPSEYQPYSNKRINWVCNYGHRWSAIISNRTRQNNNCPICYKNESWSENYLFTLLSQKYKVMKLQNPEIDIYIPELNIGIEYDGYYHKSRELLDIKKNEWAKNNLNKLIRIREEYLPELPEVENIITIKQKNSSRSSTQNSFSLICSILGIDIATFDLDVDVESKIRNYNLPLDIVNSWSKNNTIQIEKSLKTHKYKWICCKCNSEYQSSLRDRLKGISCPFCASQKVNSTNSLSKTHTYLMKYISPNNEIDPDKITYGTGKKLKFILNSREYNDTPRNFNRYLDRID